MTARMAYPSAVAAGLEARSQARQHGAVAAGGVETARMIIVLFGRPVIGVTQNEGSIANVLWVVDGDCGCGAVAEQVRGDAAAEFPFRTGDDLKGDGSMRQLDSVF